MVADSHIVNILRQEITTRKHEISKLTLALNLLINDKSKGTRKPLSVAARKRISDSQKKAWTLRNRVNKSGVKQYSKSTEKLISIGGKAK